MNIQKVISTKAQGKVMTLDELRQMLAMADAVKMPGAAAVKAQIRYGGGVKELVIDGEGASE